MARIHKPVVAQDKTSVASKPVKLGEGHLAEIATIRRLAGDGPANARKAESEAVLRQRQEKGRVYVQQQMERISAEGMELVQTKTGLGLIKGSGTQWNGVFTKTRGLELCELAEGGQLREFFESLPDEYSP